MPSPEKPGAKPTTPDPMEVEEREESSAIEENVLEEVDLPALKSKTEKRDDSSPEEEPRKIEVMLPLHPSTSKSSESGTSSGSRTSRDVGYASASPSQKSIPVCKITKSAESGSDGSLESSRSRKKSRTPEKGGRSPRQLSREASASPLGLDKTKLGSESQTGLRSPKSPKSPRSPIKDLVEGIGRLVREHSPLNFGKKLFKSKGDGGSEDEDQPLVGGGTSKQGKKSKSGKSKKKSEGKKKSPRKKSPEKVTTESELLGSDTESDATVSTELTQSSELKDKGLRKIPETAVVESEEEMDTDDQQESLSESEPESPTKTTPPLPEKDSEEHSGESSTNQQEKEVAGQIPGEKPKPERRLSKDGEPKESLPLKRSKTE